MDDIRRVVAEHARWRRIVGLSDRSAEQRKRFNATFRIFATDSASECRDLSSALYLLQRRETDAHSSFE